MDKKISRRNFIKDAMVIGSALGPAFFLAGCINKNNTTKDTTKDLTKTQPTEIPFEPTIQEKLADGATPEPTWDATTEASPSKPVTVTISEPAEDDDDAANFIANVADVPENSEKSFQVNGENAILVNYEGRFHAYINKCTHKGCPTHFVVNKFQCTCHGAEFDIVSGKAIKGPATSPLTRVMIRKKNEKIYLR